MSQPTVSIDAMDGIRDPHCYRVPVWGTLDGSQMLRTAIVTVTPKMAESWLANNPGNRRVDQSAVTQMAALIKADQWRLTHQGILLGKNGVLLDGQHRLLAIVKAGKPVVMQVTTDEAADSVLGLPVDIGMKRTTSFLLGVTPHFAGVLNLMTALIHGRRLAPVEQIPYIDKLRATYPLIAVDGKRTATRVFSSAPVTLAACVQAKLHPDHIAYYQATYHALCTSDPVKLSPMGYSFWRQYSHVRAVKQQELYARAIRAFNYDMKDLTKLQWKNYELALSQAIELTKQAFS